MRARLPTLAMRSGAALTGRTGRFSEPLHDPRRAAAAAGEGRVLVPACEGKSEL